MSRNGWPDGRIPQSAECAESSTTQSKCYSEAMRRGEQMRRDALRRYLVYKMKLMELIHLNVLWRELNDEKFAPANAMNHTGREFSQSLRIFILSSFCTIVDQSNGGLNVFKLWRELFPKHLKEIDHLWNEIEPRWKILRDFRDNCGFHGSTPKRYFEAKQQLLDNPEVAVAVQTFLRLAKRFLDLQDEELPDFASEVESFLLDLELESNISVSRDALKRLLILPRGNYTRVFG